MNSERWQKVKRLFETVVELEPAKRKRFLDKSCGTDKELRRDVENLLSSYTDAESFMEQPAAAEVASFIIEPKNLEAGKSFGHYEIIKQIGAGGMGEVYLAKDKKLDRKVAVKILNEKFAKHESNLHRFIKEAKAASALNHPNILVIHEIGETGDANYIVSEYIEGETLREVILKTSLDLPEILEIAAQIANALVSAHQANIVHRDIKPENIIVRPDGFVKILDFGLAKLVEQKAVGFEDKTVKQNETAKGVILGTVNYMSPEQAKGEKIDTRTDIFSFGVTLYEMIAGRTPFASDSMSETFANLINSEPQPLSRFTTNVPDELQRIISKTLRKKKDERYQTMKGLLADLKSLRRRLEFETELEKNSRSEKKIEEKTQIFETKTSREIPKLPPNNLSENIFPIVGREKEIAEIKNAFRQTNARLLTMTGIGGTGKTTLARAVAGELLGEFADGVFFIGLAAITDSELVVSSIGQPLGVKEAGGKPLLEILKDYLRGKQILLVLDNFEQVTDAAPAIAELLSAANRLKILITSRTLLHLSVEREFVVPPLSLPSDISQVSFDELSNYEAVKLFDQSARNIKPNFALTEENANDVAEICARLDGLPLAIELAAARIKILSPRAILAKLENRLKLLTGGASDLPARQQTMRGAIEWSYDILTANEKKLFRRLSVFAGGFSFEAAEAVCGNDELSKDRIEVLDLITSLVDKSLIGQKEQPNDEFRFRMLEVVREYAAEFLEASGESEAARKNHAAFFLQLAETAQPHFFGEQGAKWLDRLEEEYDNLRAALSWSAVSDAEMTINLTVAVRTFWILHNHLTEGRKWFEAALERATDAPSDIRFKLLYGFGQAATYQGDIETARQKYEESLAVSKEAGEKRQIALASRGLGTIAKLRGDFSTARKFIDESLKISRELNDKLGIAVSLNNLGDLARMESDFKKARPLLEEALAISRETGNKEGICGSLNNLGASAFGEGNFAAASIHYAEAITTALDLGDKITVSYSLDGFAALALKRGKKENAARLAGAIEHLHQSIGFVVEPAERRFRDAYLSELKIKMDKAAFSKFYEQGRKMKLEEAVALCLEERNEQTAKFLEAKTTETDVTGQINSIAVLPFANMSADAENEYFCDGLAEELLNALAKIKNLKVAARTSAFSFKNRNIDVSEIGNILNVKTILEGSVRKAGNRLRISVQLINASNGYHLWSERYDGEMKDVFDLQDEITLAV
ncbi:MAG: protein kinase, partial [Acidobacteriota bacterium]